MSENAESKVEEILNKVAKNNRPEVKLTDEDKENFYKMFLSDKPYTEDVKVFGGKVSLRFKVLLVSEQEELFAQVSKDEAAGVNTTSPTYLNQIQFYRLIYSLVSVNGIDPFESVKPKEDQTIIQAKLEHLKNTYHTTKIYVINNAFVRFEEKVEALAKAMTDENF